MTEQTGMIMLPGSPLIVETTQEAHFAISLKDWRRLRRKIDALKARRREFAAFAWAMVGIFFSVALSLAAWTPSYASFPLDVQHQNEWQTPTLIVSLAASAVLAVVGFWAAHSVAEQTRVTAREILEDMDDIHGDAG